VRYKTQDLLPKKIEEEYEISTPVVENSNDEAMELLLKKK